MEMTTHQQLVRNEAIEKSCCADTFVSVSDYGNAYEKAELVSDLYSMGWVSYVNRLGCVVVPVEREKIGQFFNDVANNEKTVWIEFTVQFS